MIKNHNGEYNCNSHAVSGLSQFLKCYVHHSHILHVILSFMQHLTVSPNPSMDVVPYKLRLPPPRRFGGENNILIMKPRLCTSRGEEERGGENNIIVLRITVFKTIRFNMQMIYKKTKKLVSMQIIMCNIIRKSVIINTYEFPPRKSSVGTSLRTTSAFYRIMKSAWFS